MQKQPPDPESSRQAPSDSALFRGSYSYRKPQVGIISLLCTGFFLPLLCLFSREMFRPHSFGELLLGSGLCVFTGVLTLIGMLFGYSNNNGPTTVLVINEHRVTYGRRYFQWKHLGTITRDPRSRELQLMIQKPGRMPLMRAIWIDGGLSSAEYSNLMRLLSNRVAPSYPHLRFT